MKPLLINTKQIGGAAISCRRLLNGLIEENIEAKLLVRDKQFNDDYTYGFYQSSVAKRIHKLNKIIRKKINIKSKLEILLENRSRNGLEYFSSPHSSLDITESHLYSEASVINLHWVAGFLDYSTFFKKNKKPVVWTLHDMNPFTGGEHYRELYHGINEAGYPVLRKKDIIETKVERKYFEVKKRAFQECDNLTIVAPSKWLFNEAKNSELFSSKNVLYVPYGLNQNIFAPREKKFARALLNLPESAIVLLFVADSISNQRKGFAYLLDSLKKLTNPDVILCAVGSEHAKNDNKTQIKYFGHIQDELMMSIIYSASDAFIIPSLMDNLPNTTLEAQMCGTPVIGFAVGGIIDVVQDGRTGLLCPEISVDAMRNTIDSFIHSANDFDRNYIRDYAVSNYSLHIQALKYISIFSGI